MIQQAPAKPSTQIDVSQYERTIIYSSGGKDSLACVLWAIENGCKNIELWHHLVDGREGSKLMDWPITTPYCQAVADHLDLPIYFSWLEGGIEQELCKENAKKAKTWFETLDGLKSAGGVRGKVTSRKKWPAKSGDLLKRWCSSVAKIDVGAMAIRNQDRFNNSKTLVLTGERAEESPKRADYLYFEPDRSDNRSGKSGRHVDRIRPVHQWKECEVWAIIRSHGIVPHPAYYLGWGRLSCMACIFGSVNQWATIRAIAPDHFDCIAKYELEFNHTIDNKFSVAQLADLGIPYPEALNNPALAQIALSESLQGFVVSVEPNEWQMPAGAYGESNGPT